VKKKGNVNKERRQCQLKFLFIVFCLFLCHSQ
jgi:nitrate reductase NapE component